MPDSSNETIMRRFTGEFLPTGDAALGEKFLDPGVVMHFAGQRVSGRAEYLAAVAANKSAFPDLVWTVEDMVVEGDRVAIRYTMTGTQEGAFAGIPASGRSVRAQSMGFYRLSEGRIVEERALLDMLSVQQQIGTPAAL